MTAVRSERYAGSTGIQTLLSDGGSGSVQDGAWRSFGGRGPVIDVAGYDMSLFYTTGRYGLGDGNYGTVYGKVYAIFNDGTSRLLYNEYIYPTSGTYSQGNSRNDPTGPHYVANYLSADEKERIKQIKIVGYGYAVHCYPDSYHSGDAGIVSYIYLCGRKIPWVAE